MARSDLRACRGRSQSLGSRRQGAETALATIAVLLPRDGPEAHKGQAGRLSFQGGYGRVPRMGHANDRLRRHLSPASYWRERQRLRSRRAARGVAQRPCRNHRNAEKRTRTEERREGKEGGRK